MWRAPDALRMPGTLETPEEVLARALPLYGTPGQSYVERRGIPVKMAEAADVRYAADFGGRPAVVVALRDNNKGLASVHGRYLNVLRGQDKMLTIGPGGGTVNLLGGWRAEPVVVVEGLFDALSLLVCGYASVATIGRWVPWFPSELVGRTVWLAFDAGRPGEAEVARYAKALGKSDVRRMLPPGRSKDWNTALLKCGTGTVARWVQDCLIKSR